MCNVVLIFAMICEGPLVTLALYFSQVCDSEWHHLSLSVQFPSVTLYVDGVTFDPALIHDNGAIPNPVPRERLVIGACWGMCTKAPFMYTQGTNRVRASVCVCVCV